MIEDSYFKGARIEGLHKAARDCLREGFTCRLRNCVGAQTCCYGEEPDPEYRSGKRIFDQQTSYKKRERVPLWMGRAEALVL